MFTLPAGQPVFRNPSEERQWRFQRLLFEKLQTKPRAEIAERIRTGVDNVRPRMKGEWYGELLDTWVLLAGDPEGLAKVVLSGSVVGRDMRKVSPLSVWDGLFTERERLRVMGAGRRRRGTPASRPSPAGVPLE